MSSTEMAKLSCGVSRRGLNPAQMTHIGGILAHLDMILFILIIYILACLYDPPPPSSYLAPSSSLGVFQYVVNASTGSRPSCLDLPSQMLPTVENLDGTQQSQKIQSQFQVLTPYAPMQGFATTASSRPGRTTASGWRVHRASTRASVTTAAGSWTNTMENAGRELPCACSPVSLPAHLAV